jgi:ADP-heptose:LPS heptosyltransferase
MKNCSLKKNNLLVVKPDHIGDLILTLPAINQLVNYYNVSILISESNIELAKKIFKNINIKIFTNYFSYLSKSNDIYMNDNKKNILSFLNLFHKVVFLRNDEIMDKLFNNVMVDKFIVENRIDLHETIIQRNCLEKLVPLYNPNDFFCTKKITKAENVGFSIGAGFTTNKWPDVYWIELIDAFIKRGVNVYLIGGPLEKESIRFIKKSLNINDKNIIEGDKNFDFIDKLSFLDFVIASDSGVAHICSLKTPVISIFGSSPFIRYAPTGYNNFVLTLNLECSPCCQYHPLILNACVTRECMIFIKPEQVYDIIKKILNNEFNFKKNNCIYYNNILICKNLVGLEKGEI